MSTRKIVKKPAAKQAPKHAKVKAKAKKVVAKATPAKAAKPAKKVAPKAFKPKALLIKAPLTKTQLLTTLAEQTEVGKKEVGHLLTSLGNIIEHHVKKNGPQVFTLPGLFKIKIVRKPATKERKGVNPFTGEETVFKAKPARNVVKIVALKKLKEMAQ